MSQTQSSLDGGELGWLSYSAIPLGNTPVLCLQAHGSGLTYTRSSKAINAKMAHTHKLTQTHVHGQACAPTLCLSSRHKAPVCPILYSGPCIDCLELQVLYWFLLISFKWTIMAMSPAVTCSYPTATCLFLSLITYNVCAVNYAPYLLWLLFLFASFFVVK